MIKVLAIDAATKTGYALIEDGKYIKGGYIKLKSKDDYRLRLRNLFCKIKGLVEELDPDLVVAEEVHSTRNAKTTILLAMYLAAVLLAVPDDVNLRTINLISARYSILKGQGRVSKEDVFNWAVKKYDLKDFKFKSDNDITDAILLAHYGFSELTKESN